MNKVLSPVLLMLGAMLLPMAASARDYWTIEVDSAGRMVNGKAFVGIKGTPTAGNHDGSWTSCPGNFVFFHEYYPGSSTSGPRQEVAPDVLQDLMGLATVAWVGKYKVRVSIDRDPADGTCYTVMLRLDPE